MGQRPNRTAQPWTIAAIALAVAAAAAFFAYQRLPYGMYSVTRTALFMGAGYGAWWFFERKSALAALIAAGTALLFNPLIPIHMRRYDWQPVDFWAGIVLVCLALYAYRLREH